MPNLFPISESVRDPPSEMTLSSLISSVEKRKIPRSLATCGPKEILQYAESPTDTYEWEFSGVRIAADASLFGGELGMISVITWNYGCLDMNYLNVAQAFGKLADFVKKFLDACMSS